LASGKIQQIQAWNPPPGDSNVSVSSILRWPAGGGALSYDVYLGTNQSAVAGAQRLLGDINGDGPADIEDLSILAAQWLTDPGTINHSADIAVSGKVDIEDFAALASDWGQIPDAEFKANWTDASYDPGTLGGSTTYYWRTDEVSSSGTATGTVQSFTTRASQPTEAINPSPTNGAANVPINADLSWTAGLGATSHDVYFGTDSTPDAGEFKGNQPSTTYDPGTLVNNTTYYWRIDEVNSYGTTTGTVWSFMTISPFLPFTLWQLPSQSGAQMNSYVIQTYNGSVMVIDGGYDNDAAYLKSFLSNLGNHVDMWFISHRHRDHVEALTTILNNPGSLTIGTIYGSMPTLSWLQTHDTNAYNETVSLNSALSAAGKTVTEVSLGQMIYLDGVATKILSIKNPELTAVGDNDQSMVMKVWDNNKSVMFLGDLYIYGGNKLLNTWGSAELNSDYVQMAHHGQQGVNYNVYEAISPTYCLWPTPSWLWDWETTQEVYGWMQSLGVQGHYFMFSGLQTIP
jgi:beta-lactamase superfamily II metal-dependent hydrolase